jgi:putative transposase
MARTARLVVPGLAHHVIQRGARRLQVFFEPSDYRLYRLLLGRESRRHGLAVWAYCLMPNHVHLVVVPPSGDALARVLRRAHGRYAELVNRRLGCKGHLWQERFHSCPMDEGHLFHALRYVLLNPVRAGLAAEAADWRWSNAQNLLHRAPDPLADTSAVSRRFPDLLGSTDGSGDDAPFEALRACSRTGRILAPPEIVRRFEESTGVPLARRPPGRPRRALEASVPAGQQPKK